MKHLKRIFENTEDLDTDYIEMCFVDFIDKGCEVEVENAEDGRKYIDLMIDYPGVEIKNGKFINNNKSNTIDDALKSSKEVYDFYDELNTCIKKVKLEYPNIKVEFVIEKEGYDEDVDPFNAYIHLTFILPKNIKRIPLEKGKLGTVKFSDLDNTWDVRSEDEN